MAKTRIGLIGCGGIANFHVSHLILMDDVEIVAVADPVEEKRVKMAQKVGAKRMYKNHTELYDNESAETLDAIYICVEPTAHTDTELRAIEAGLPFLVEKPMTLDIALAEKIVKLVEEKKLITAVGFQDRYLDIYNQFKKEVENAPKQGGIVYASWLGGIPMVWWWLKKSTCGGQLVEQNIHLLDGLRYVFGEPKNVYATCTRGIVSGVPDYDTDDHSTAIIEFENNYTAVIASACYLDRGNRARSGVKVLLADKVVDYGLRHDLIVKEKNEIREYQAANDQGFDEDRTFIDAVQSGDGSRIRSPYPDAFKSLRLALAANESMETGKKIDL